MPPPTSWWRSPTGSRQSRTAAFYIVLVNGAFLEAGGTPDQFGAALALGLLLQHGSRTYAKFTPAGGLLP
jgi:hypothetical protein